MSEMTVRGEHLLNGETVVIIDDPDGGSASYAGRIWEGTYQPCEWIEDYRLTPDVLRGIAALIEEQA